MTAKKRKFYPLNQCALYKLGSKKRLAGVLGTDLASLLRLAKDDGNFQVYERPEEVCEFTGKKKKARWVQNPVPELKAVLKRVVKLLSRVETPDYCHGGARGKSYRSNAEAHIAADSVGNYDLESFFPSTTSTQVYHFFRWDLLCEPDVAGLLTDLCTYRKALPTGAPSSPVIALWANRRLFEALKNRGASLDLNFSVYADDLTFSGKKLPHSLTDQVSGLVEKHGHSLSKRKTKFYLHGQAKHITGVVVSGGRLLVPHERFRKARLIRAALAMTSDIAQREKLASKLCGLLGEAAYLDKRFKPWADASYTQLAAIRANRTATA